MSRRHQLAGRSMRCREVTATAVHTQPELGAVPVNLCGCFWLSPSSVRIGDVPWANANPERMRTEVVMSRDTGARYVCEKCGAVLVYEKGCPCPDKMAHAEICCGQQMKALGSEKPSVKG